MSDHVPIPQAGRTRILEAEDTQRLNHGKFLIVECGEQVFASSSTVFPERSVIDVLPTVKRFGQIRRDALWVLDLQTQEGIMMCPSWNEKQITTRFLCHPVQVCILFLPLMHWISRNASSLWTFPHAVELSTEAVLDQPGTLYDSTGNPVLSFSEWSKRPPAKIAARFRNREVDFAELTFQYGLTDEEFAAAQLPKAVW